mmetsp:Transcript_76391/g.224080  ORF Transcript_76391/g.224080 Transcript_76391/m.224080 type:complete len:104 (+) Transcript_76391:497-808(+)
MPEANCTGKAFGPTRNLRTWELSPSPQLKVEARSVGLQPHRPAVVRDGQKPGAQVKPNDIAASSAQQGRIHGSLQNDVSPAAKMWAGKCLARHADTEGVSHMD